MVEDRAFIKKFAASGGLVKYGFSIASDIHVTKRVLAEIISQRRLTPLFPVGQLASELCLRRKQMRNQNEDAKHAAHR